MAELAGLYKRLLKGIGANAAAQLANIGMQLLSVPLFLSFWDVSQYGYWVILSAVPAYFSMADVGIVTVAMNEITMFNGRGDYEKSNILFNSVLLYLMLIVGGLSIVSILIVAILPSGLLPIGAWKIVCAVLIINALLSLFNGAFDTVFRSTGRYSDGICAIQSIRVFEWLGGVLLLIEFKTMLAVASGMLIGRIVSMFAAFLYAKRNIKIFMWCARSGQLGEIKKIFIPGLQFLSFPVGNAIYMQGMTVLIGAVIGPAAVSIFNTYRTISRTTVQFVSMLSHTLWPEFSRLYGNNEKQNLVFLYKKGCIYSGASAFLSGLVLYEMTPLILHYWTHGKIAYDEWYSLLFVITTVLASLWHVPRILLISTNNHTKVSICYLLFCIAAILSAFFIINETVIGGVLSVMIVFELSMWFVCVVLIKKLGLA